MAYQKVDRGSSANDGTGDTLRVGADKINENFEDLFAKINGVANSAINDGAALTSDNVVLRASTDTLTNKTIALGSNTVSGTTAQFNTALSDGSFTTLAGTETLTNKTLTNPTINGATFSGTLAGAIIGGVESKSGAGALSLTHLITEVTSTGTDAITLANGTAGQVKIITMIVDGGNATLTPATFHDGTTVTFDAVGESVVLVYHNTIGWKAVSVSGATIG